MRITLLDQSALPQGSSLEPLEALGELVVYEQTAPIDSFFRLDGVDAVLTCLVPVTRQLLDWAPRVKDVFVLSGKPDLVDMVAAADLGVRVTVISPEEGSNPLERVASLLQEPLS